MKTKIHPKNVLAVDIETVGLNPHETEHWDKSYYGITYIGFWDKTGTGKVFDLRDKDQRWEAYRHLVSPLPKVFWNAQFDLYFLEQAGIKVVGPILDAMIAARIVTPYQKSFSLKFLAGKYLDALYTEEQEVHKWLKEHGMKGRIGLAPRELIGPYLLKDVQYTYELFQLFWKGLEDTNQMRIFQRECKLIKVCLGMRKVGIKVDRKGVENLIQEAEEKFQLTVKELQEDLAYPDFNPLSPGQVAEVLSGGCESSEIPLSYFPHVAKRTATGAPSCDELSLLKEGSEYASKILIARKLRKAISTYLKPLLKSITKTGTVHPQFNINQAITGRFSSSGGINFQNLPRPGSTKKGRDILGKVRSCLVAREGHAFAFCDFDQIELRLAAHFSRDPLMLKAIKEGKNLHEETAKAMFLGYNKFSTPEKKRYYYIAKTINFAVLYGAGYYQVANTILLETSGSVRLTPDEAKMYLDSWWSIHPAIREFFDRIESEVRRTEGIQTPYGRFIPVNPDKAYTGVNYLIQSTAGEVMKDAMLKLRRLDSVCLVATIHDELIFEGKISELMKALPFIHRSMEQLDRFSVPITCSIDVGFDWAKRKEVEKPIHQGIKKIYSEN